MDRQPLSWRLETISGFSACHRPNSPKQLRPQAHLLGVPPVRTSQESQASGGEEQCPRVWTKAPIAQRPLAPCGSHPFPSFISVTLETMLESVTGLGYLFNSQKDLLKALGNQADIQK